jgi:hypothetical protein
MKIYDYNGLHATSLYKLYIDTKLILLTTKGHFLREGNETRFNVEGVSIRSKLH